MPRFRRSSVGLASLSSCLGIVLLVSLCRLENFLVDWEYLGKREHGIRLVLLLRADATKLSDAESPKPAFCLEFAVATVSQAILLRILVSLIFSAIIGELYFWDGKEICELLSE